MKKRIIAFVTVIMIILSATYVGASATTKTTKVLLMGNSVFFHSNANAVSMCKKIFPAICNDKGAGNENIELTCLTHSGATMFQFYEKYDGIVSNMDSFSTDLTNGDLFTENSNEKFDYVILNPSRRCNIHNKDNEYSKFEIDATCHFIEIAQRMGAKVILCAQFGFNSDDMTNYYLSKLTDEEKQALITEETTEELPVVNINAEYKQKKNTKPFSRKDQVNYNNQFCKAIAEKYKDVGICHIGDAFELSYEEIDENLYDDDNIHYNTVGSYLEACCLYEMLFNKSCFAYTTKTDYLNDDELKKVLQAIADVCVLGDKVRTRENLDEYVRTYYFGGSEEVSSQSVSSESDETDKSPVERKVIKKPTYFATGKTEVYSGGKLISVEYAPKKVLATPKVRLSYSSKSVKVKWNKVKDATGYTIKYKKTTAKTLKKIRIGKAKTVSKKLSGLKKGKKYNVWVRSFRKENGKYAFSKWKKLVTKKIK